MVKWYDIGQLARTTLQVAISEALGTRIDPRRLRREGPNEWGNAQKGTYLPAPPKTGEYNAEVDDMWFDYVADVADGYAPCRAIADRLACEHLTAKAENGKIVDTQRGSLLILGGDLVYPTPGPGAYLERFIQPYGEAWFALNGERKNEGQPLPCRMLAIPGNHDWYDSLVEFSDIFLGSPRSIGGWEVGQERSYFATELRKKFWIWAVDVQLEGRLDGPQLQYFETMAEIMEEGSRIILIGAEPEWLQSVPGNGIGNPGDGFGVHGELRSLLARQGGKGRFILHIAGDLHHYRRHVEAFEGENGKAAAEVVGGRQWVVCGGGGAFAYPTHNVAGDGDIVWNGGKVLKPVACFPNIAQSKALSRWIGLTFPLRNWGFSTSIGVIYTAIAWGLPKLSGNLGATGTNGNPPESVILKSAWQDFQNNPGAFLANTGTTSYLLALAIPAVGYVVAQRLDSKNWWLPWFGVLHGIIHSFSAVALYFLVMELFGSLDAEWIGTNLNSLLSLDLLGGIARAFSYFGAASILGGCIFGTYLKLAHSLGRVHANELYSAIGSPDYKSFLRFHLHQDGSLDVFVLGFERCPSEWKGRLESSDSGPETMLVDKFQFPADHG
jgi:hypothetical protein